MRNLWYFGLEPLKERYTHQLSNEWIPDTFKDKDINFIPVNGQKQDGKINTGSVLDAYGRGVYSMTQCQKFMQGIATGVVKDNDIVYLQDFWTPGIEAVFYMLDLYNIKVKFYSMLHAQSVDEYDFTHNMKKWMRNFELGIDKRHDGIFVGSSIHKQQLRDAGFEASIHVVSLPIHKDLAFKVLSDYVDFKDVEEEKTVIYTSRLDKEKNPYFMIKTALKFLAQNKDYKWIVTTSGDDFKSGIDGFVEYMKEVAQKEPRLVLMNNLTKEEYYRQLYKAKIQFNCSLQDYVSWTLLESTLFGCDICYPNFRSFPEILSDDRMYKAFDIDSAISVLNDCIQNPKTHQNISKLSDLGRRLEAHIMLNDIDDREFNIWYEYEYIKKLIEL